MRYQCLTGQRFTVFCQIDISLSNIKRFSDMSLFSYSITTNEYILLQ